MIRRPPRSTLDRSSAASDVYKRQSGMYLKFYRISLNVNQINYSIYIDRNNNGYSDAADTAFSECLIELNDGNSTSVYKPVSYTHLRAHETVLDLVCRLLLEKKKI